MRGHGAGVRAQRARLRHQAVLGRVVALLDCALLAGPPAAALTHSLTHPHPAALARPRPPSSAALSAAALAAAALAAALAAAIAAATATATADAAAVPPAATRV